ncbi:MAG: hypothetical protein LBD59_07920 [Prevotellaceae bacterium]|nr:hypothetical protein [Prevotellaceae bacterium]
MFDTTKNMAKNSRHDFGKCFGNGRTDGRRLGGVCDNRRTGIRRLGGACDCGRMGIRRLGEVVAGLKITKDFKDIKYFKDLLTGK